MRLLLLLAVVALGADAIMNNGAYTRAAWEQLSMYSLKLVGPEQQGPGSSEPSRS